ncbi:MAG TPA: phosphatidylserine/phosphatidylglycerophosphate/cardiolipin synthase family protein [Thermoanaerobaculia bacterium]|jgi:putative cardiolipin synthase
MRSSGLALLVVAALAAGARADAIRILDDPREAAQARADIIQQARGGIDAVYFLARNDRVTLTALKLLRDARRRGVGRVRLIVDANFQHIPRPVLGHLRDEGVQVRVYHPLTLRHPSWIFRRMHEKFVVVDGERYIAGGRNLAESYFGLDERNFVDRDVYVDGASAAEAERHFEALWNSKHVADLWTHVSAAEKRNAGQHLDDAARALVCDGFLELDTGRDWAAERKDVAGVRFLHDSAGGGPQVRDGIIDALRQAKQSIVIETPYLVPQRELIDLLLEKLREGVYVLIVTNSLRSIDGVLPHAGYIKYRHRLIRAGVDMREYKGPDALHAKSVVVDGRTALVGSYNVDPRSANLNTEVMAVAEDREVAREVLDAIEVHVQNAWRVDRHGRPPREERAPMRVSIAKAVRAWAARLILPLIENQL